MHRPLLGLPQLRWPTLGPTRALGHPGRGEELHNNHHAYGSSEVLVAAGGVRPGLGVHPRPRVLRLATVRKVAPKLASRAAKPARPRHAARSDHPSLEVRDELWARVEGLLARELASCASCAQRRDQAGQIPRRVAACRRSLATEPAGAVARRAARPPVAMLAASLPLAMVTAMHEELSGAVVAARRVVRCNCSSACRIGAGRAEGLRDKRRSRASRFQLKRYAETDAARAVLRTGRPRSAGFFSWQRPAKSEGPRIGGPFR